MKKIIFLILLAALTAGVLSSCASGPGYPGYRGYYHGPGDIYEQEYEQWRLRQVIQEQSG